MTRALVLVLLASLPSLARAQDPAAQALIARSRAALAPIARIVGRWEGDARAWNGPGDPVLVRQHEEVEWRAGGTVITIRGTGLDPASRDTVFEAAAMLWFDPETGRLRMRTHRDGRSVEPELEIRPDTVVWGFAVPGGRVRYTIALGADSWHEVGHFLRDGAPPVRTLEMRLRRR